MRYSKFMARADVVTQEDHEIFDLVSALEKAEGECSMRRLGVYALMYVL